MYQRSVPNFDNFKALSKKTKAGRDIGVFQYTSTTGKHDYLNYFILTDINSKELLFNYNIEACNCNKISNDFFIMLNSINQIQ